MSSVHDDLANTVESEQETVTAVIPPELAGERFDKAVARLFPDFSRTVLQRWLKQGQILLEGQCPRQRDIVVGGELVELQVVSEGVPTWNAEDIPLCVVFEDADLLVINKPAGLVVHPGAGNRNGTLANALLAHCPGNAALPRAGIVHRLDKDTSGLLVVAKSEHCRRELIRALERREISRRYVALVSGGVITGGTIDAPIGRHPRDRLRFAVTSRGKRAITHYRVQARFHHHTWLSVDLETGRTHQIRVHLQHLGFPIVGDPLYGGRLKVPPGATQDLINGLRGMKRQALHATRLRLTHPTSGKSLTWEAALPEDLLNLLTLLEPTKTFSADDSPIGPTA